MLLGISTEAFYRSEMNLGKRLKLARDARKLTQEQLAELVPGANQPMISALESRDSKTSTLLFGFAKALNVEAQWLQDGVGDSGIDGLSAHGRERKGPRIGSRA